MKGGTLEGLGAEVYQVVLDLRDPEVNREREALMVVQVTQEASDGLVIKVSLCIHTMCVIVILSLARCRGLLFFNN